MTISAPTNLRRNSLRQALPESIDMLSRRRAGEIPTGYIDEYVALNWLEWHGGGLRVTAIGETVHREVVDKQLMLSAAF